MFTHVLRAAHFARLAVAITVVLLFASQTTQATDVVLIEEHWELHVGGPDEARSAPQVTMTMSPTNDVENTFFVVTLNHWSYPDFAAGGIQIQRWSGEDCVEATSNGNQSTLAQDEEVIKWTQRIRLVDGHLVFQIVDGHSSTWGSFGGSSALTLSHATQLTRLNQYRPAVSIDQSGIAYAGNRVSSLVLKKLRWQTIDEEFHELVAPIDIATELDP